MTVVADPECVCQGTGIVTTLTEGGGNTGPTLCGCLHESTPVPVREGGDGRAFVAVCKGCEMVVGVAMERDATGSERDVRVYHVSSRGFKHYEPIASTYGDAVRVYESSAASAPHLWISLDPTRSTIGRDAPGDPAAHLSIEQAEHLIATLRAAIDNHYQAPAPVSSEPAGGGEDWRRDPEAISGLVAHAIDASHGRKRYEDRGELGDETFPCPACSPAPAGDARVRMAHQRIGPTGPDRPAPAGDGAESEEAHLAAVAAMHRRELLAFGQYAAIVHPEDLPVDYRPGMKLVERVDAAPADGDGRACEHCPDGHREPGSRPMVVEVGPVRDKDGQPITLTVSYASGHHVSEREAEWLRTLIACPTLSELLTSEPAIEAACIADAERYAASSGLPQMPDHEAVEVYGESNRKLLAAVAARISPDTDNVIVGIDPAGSSDDPLVVLDRETGELVPPSPDTTRADRG